MNVSKGVPIVAIGASSGGLGAMMELIRNINPDTGMGFLYLQYPGGEQTDEIIARLQEVATMKVEQARDQLQILPNSIYVIPGEQEIQITDGMLSLIRPTTRKNDRLPIDRFFTVLARTWKAGIIGILLSGEELDGAGGLKAIKIAGGITFAQDETAAFDEMPKSAMTAGVVDLVLSPVQIGRELNKMAGQVDAFAEMQIGSNVVSDTDEHLLSIIQLLRRATGIDFTHYKISTIKRRIIRRMLLYKLHDLKGYYEYLKRHANEITVLYHDLLINVTCFFRDGDSMEYLRKSVLPQILKGKSSDEQVRIWVPACSTGEEAYSLAILITELQEESGTKIPIQIFGTDLSEIAISKARSGVYSPADLTDIADTRISKFFVRTENNNFRVHKRIRDLCIFAQHNVFKDPPFSRLDLVS
ncbi:MAG TPA: chemotaxis protein CheB, partial [Puia sp.]|nr:chemotaxis protein CheB [Puia sp.]